MFNKVLVANRGEISLRIVRTLQKLKIPSVAIYHFVDRQAPFVAAADEAIQIDAESPTAAYLDIEQIVTIARQVGVDAIHPGYGFLAENALFCRAIRGAEITFIGPNEDVIELMGDKLASRDFAQQIGVPVAPSATQTGDADSFITEANKIGYPLLIKAAAGGGGKGMSIVHDHESLAKAVEIARSEACLLYTSPSPRDPE